MRILVLGSGGHLGRPTVLCLSGTVHRVGVVVSVARRGCDTELGSTSLEPIDVREDRTIDRLWMRGRLPAPNAGNLTDCVFTYDVFGSFRPDAVVHFSERRPDPYSMIDQAHGACTQTNNLVGTPDVRDAIAPIDQAIHLRKLGSTGEYETADVDIAEGWDPSWIEVAHEGRTTGMLWAERPGSLCHLPKVHDSHGIGLAWRAWGPAATELDLDPSVRWRAASSPVGPDEPAFVA